MESVADGYNGTIFAYGQTGIWVSKVGCGKTFTMIGDPSSVYFYSILGNCERYHTKDIRLNNQHYQ